MRGHPHLDLRFWTDRAYLEQAVAKIHTVDPHVQVSVIHSGKIRRYHTLPVWRQLLRWKTIVGPNIRDGFFVGLGTTESFCRLLAWRPDVVFLKGGYTCLPVGIAARCLSIPIVLHDSDTHPGLANRLLSRWAARIGTGAPLKYYSYSPRIARYVGIPVDSSFRQFSIAERKKAKKALGFDEKKPLVVVTGGGLGAQSINTAISHILPELLQKTNVLLLCGATNYHQLAKELADYETTQFRLKAFVSSGMADILGAADVVVARAGATTLLEVAALSQPTILVPNPYLTAGHQLTNAKQYADADAAYIVDEREMVADSSVLAVAILDLIADTSRQKAMRRAIAQFATPNAARDMATMILEAISTSKRG